MSKPSNEIVGIKVFENNELLGKFTLIIPTSSMHVWYKNPDLKLNVEKLTKNNCFIEAYYLTNREFENALPTISFNYPFECF